MCKPKWTRTGEKDMRPVFDKIKSTVHTPRVAFHLRTGLFGCLLVLGLCLYSPALVHARLIFDPTDAAFTNATVETLDNIGLVNGQQSFMVTLNNVQFSFSTTSPKGLFVCTGGVASGCALTAFFP